MESIKKKLYVLVTGGAGGIGSEVCKNLKVLGFQPIIIYNKNKIQAELLAQQLNTFSVQMNMIENSSIDRGIKKIEKIIDIKEDQIIGLILGASPPPDLMPLSRIETSSMLNQFSINVLGSHYLTSILIRKFFKKSKSGIIIGILTAAIGDKKSLPISGMGSYVIAKSALKAMLQAFKAEHPWLNIKTTSPSFTDTPMLDVFDKRYLELINKDTPIESPKKIALNITKEFKNEKNI
jgi:short-subunit dehydrogenase